MARGDILFSVRVSIPLPVLFSKIPSFESEIPIIFFFRFQDQVVANVRQGYTGRQVFTLFLYFVFLE